ncbi:MAG: DEAD/DEAH box helicase [Thiothrix nivea]|nr:MAG: DEAD/DEAH box helicase [Thiothrix nivea]
MSFVNLGLHESMAANIADAGYEDPTELQEQLIPLMLQRKDVIVWTQSAAGKTGAFLIPAIDYLLNNPLDEYQGARILILTSRRDRVNQITYTVKRLLGDSQQIRTGFIVSGRPYQPQMRLLRRPLDLMIATPGRLNDLVDNGKADFSGIELLIIDDLTAIYKKDLATLVDKIVAQKPETTPIVAFVRPDEEVTPYTQNLLQGASEITIEDEKSQLLQLKQQVHRADDFSHKLDLTHHLLNAQRDKPAVIFTNSSKTAKTLADHLANLGHTADATHLLAPEERNLEACPILIVPDDENFIPEMDGHVPVIHFEIPETADAYSQRLKNLLGTEAHTEMVTLLVAHVEKDNLRKLEEFLGEKLENKNIPGLEPKQNPRSKKAGTKPGRKPQQRKPGIQTRGRKGVATTNDRQRTRKGPFGRINSGGNAQRKSGKGKSLLKSTPSADGNYEIGSWESQDYTARKKPDTEKKVVIRYKEKKRRTLIK